MTIGKSSKKQKAPRSPPFLDRASGFDGRLDEIETEKAEKRPAAKPTTDDQESCVFDFSEGMMEDDGTTLLKRKPSRLSRRWSRKSSKRNKSDESSLYMDVQNPETELAPSNNSSPDVHSESETASGRRAPVPTLVHFSIREEADDQKLIPGGKQKQREIKDIKTEGGEVEGKTDVESMKIVKRNSVRNYRKVLDKALRRGWETFVANLYSVTLSPVSPSVSSPSKAEMDRKAALADFR